jgi:hypothetical protein
MRSFFTSVFLLLAGLAATAASAQVYQYDAIGRPRGGNVRNALKTPYRAVISG